MPLGTVAALIVLAALSAGLAVGLITAELMRQARASQSRSVLADRLGSRRARRATLSAGDLTGAAIAAAARIAPRGLTSLATHPTLVRNLSAAGIAPSAGLLMFAALASIGLVATAWALTHSGLLALVALGVSAATTALWIRGRGVRRANDLRSQIPALFVALSSAMGAGMSLAQAVRRAEMTARSPLDRQLADLRGDLDLGMGAGPALERFASSTELVELRPLAVAIGVQQLAGGEVVSLIEHAAEQLRHDEHVRDLIRAKTAQGRLSSGMVTAIPIVLTAGLAVLSPEYLDYFLGEATGRWLLATAVTLQTLGVLVVRRVLAIKVG